MGSRLIRWSRSDPMQRIVTPSRRWARLGVIPFFYTAYASRLVLPGPGSGSYLDTPDSAAFTPPLSADFEVRALVAPTTWTTASIQNILSQAGSSVPQNGWCFFIPSSQRQLTLQL